MYTYTYMLCAYTCDTCTHMYGNVYRSFSFLLFEVTVHTTVRTRSGVLLCRATFYPYKARDFPDLSLPDTPVPLWNAREHLVSCCFRVVP